MGRTIDAAIDMLPPDRPESLLREGGARGQGLIAEELSRQVAKGGAADPAELALLHAFRLFRTTRTERVDFRPSWESGRGQEEFFYWRP